MKIIFRSTAINQVKSILSGTTTPFNKIYHSRSRNGK